jgi:hypothetical protein
MIDMELREIFEKLAEVEPEWFSLTKQSESGGFAVKAKSEFKRSNATSWTWVWDESMGFFAQPYCFDACINAAVARDWEIAMARGFEHDNNHATNGRLWAVKIVGNSGAEHSFSHHENKAIAAALALIAAHSPQPKTKNVDFWKDVYDNYPK